jgi:multidrug efflux pump subunit AcrB
VPICNWRCPATRSTNRSSLDYATNFIRPQLLSVPGVAIPTPTAARPAQCRSTSTRKRCRPKGLSAHRRGQRAGAQNQIIPAGTEKIGRFEYNIKLNNSPLSLQELNNLPIKSVNGATIYMRDVAHVRDGYPPQTNIVRVDGHRAVLMSILKNGSASTLDIIAGVKAQLPAHRGDAAAGTQARHDGRSIHLREGAVSGVVARRHHRRGADRR